MLTNRDAILRTTRILSRAVEAVNLNYDHFSRSWKTENELEDSKTRYKNTVWGLLG